MEPLSQEFIQLLSQRLKLGEQAKPVCRVEVDRLAFIPGRTEKYEFAVVKGDEKEVAKIWIDPVGGSYEGSSVVTSSQIVFPAQGYSVDNVTSRWGMRTLGGATKQHRGVDVGCPVGTPILAAWDGIIKKTNFNASAGSGVSINMLHDQGYLTKYFHLSSIAVRTGQEVKAGDIIGYSGATGHVTGPHLHFELWEGVESWDTVGSRSGKNIDPYPYMSNNRLLYGSSTNTGSGVADEGVVSGRAGEVVLKEEFSRRSWMDAPYVSLGGNFTQFSYYEKTAATDMDGGRQVFSFDPVKHGDSPVTVSLTFEVEMPQEGFLDLGFYSDMSTSTLEVLVNGRMARRMTTFSGYSTLDVLKDVYVPSGTVPITVRVQWSGQEKEKLALDFLRVQALEITPDFMATKTLRKLDPFQSSSSLQVVELPQFLFNQRQDTAEIQVGEFVYLDTLQLDNVISCEIDTQYEMESAEATVTISNPNGYYSPDHNPANFPEVFELSPWSYSINGFRVGVLSENTPIRIFMGYGLNDIRVFTGMIDKVDVDGETGTLTIHCRDMYKKAIEKVLLQEKRYPDDVHPEEQKVAWMKSAIVQDLVAEAGLFGWRGNEMDLYYPDAVIEEMYLIELNERTGKVVKAVPGEEGRFVEEDISAVPTPMGWLNPFVEEGEVVFSAYQTKVAQAIQDLIGETHYRSYCDRYGTYRLEPIRFNRNVVGEFTEHENLEKLSKTLDFSRSRSHLIIQDELGSEEHFLDKEILMELKGEVRTAYAEVPWAKSHEAKRQVAERLFFDMKRMARTLQVGIPGDPSLDVLDRVIVTDHNTATRSANIIKGIRSSFSVDGGYLQVIDLMWSEEGAVV